MHKNSAHIQLQKKGGLPQTQKYGGSTNMFSSVFFDGGLVPSQANSPSPALAQTQPTPAHPREQDLDDLPRHELR